MFTRAARKALSTQRQLDRQGMGDTFVRCVMMGERAYSAGLPITANPYDPEDEDHDSWNFGWEGMDND